MQSTLIVTIQLDIRQMLPAINAAMVGLSAQALTSKIQAETSAAVGQPVVVQLKIDLAPELATLARQAVVAHLRAGVCSN